MAPLPWILLSSRVPREPTRLRLAVWRRLKRLGAVLVHDAVWMLPADARTREALEWLAEEIVQQGGTAWVWEAAGLTPVQDREAVQLFLREADVRYAEIGASARAIRDAVLRRRRRGKRGGPQSSAELAHAVRQLRGLQRALRLERRRDYFKAPGRAAVAALVEEAIAELEGRVVPEAEGVARALGD